MKIYKASEREIDERLRLDKRRDIRAFCHYFDKEEELPIEFYDLQDKIRDGLEKKFWENFDDGVNHSKLTSWEKPMNNFFFFPAELLISERIIIEIDKTIFDDRLIGLIISYLEKLSSRYCVIVSVNEKQNGRDDYIGRFVINLDEIAVEESLAIVWKQKIKLLEIE